MLKLFKKFQENIRYLIDQAFARKFVGQSLLFVTLVVSVTLVVFKPGYAPAREEKCYLILLGITTGG